MNIYCEGVEFCDTPRRSSAPADGWTPAEQLQDTELELNGQKSEKTQRNKDETSMRMNGGRKFSERR